MPNCKLDSFLTVSTFAGCINCLKTVNLENEINLFAALVGETINIRLAIIEFVKKNCQIQLFLYKVEAHNCQTIFWHLSNCRHYKWFRRQHIIQLLPRYKLKSFLMISTLPGFIHCLKTVKIKNNYFFCCCIGVNTNILLTIIKFAKNSQIHLFFYKIESRNCQTKFDSCQIVSECRLLTIS